MTNGNVKMPKKKKGKHFFFYPGKSFFFLSFFFSSQFFILKKLQSTFHFLSFVFRLSSFVFLLFLVSVVLPVPVPVPVPVPNIHSSPSSPKSPNLPFNLISPGSISVLSLIRFPSPLSSSLPPPSLPKTLCLSFRSALTQT